METDTLGTVNDLYAKYGELFSDDSFHNLLWQILVNNRFSGQEVALTYIADENTIGITVKNQGGYIPTGIHFKQPIYEKCVEYINQLNFDIFRLNPVEASLIVLSSLRG